MSRLRQLNASAGSGKTYALTEAYLGVLAGNGEAGDSRGWACRTMRRARPGLSEILAITFTNAAAAEMRSRVITRLKKAALGQAPPEEKITPGVAREWLGTILQDMSSLNIRTIDSLLHLITRSSALDLGLNPDFEAEFSISDAFEPVIDQFIDSALDNSEAREKLRSAIYATVEHGGSKGFLSRDGFSGKLAGIIEDVLLNHFEGLGDESSAQEHLDMLRQKFMDAARNLLTNALAWGAKCDKKVTNTLEKIARGEFGKTLCAYAKKTSVYELFINAEGWPGCEDLYADFAQAGREYYWGIDAVKAARSLIPVVKLAEGLVEAFYQDNNSGKILPACMAPMLAVKALAGDSGVSDALCRLGSRLTHFLVDEFQDTSQDQWSALRVLAHDALARGGSLTWVGDIKQSIYGWRGGDPRLFNDVLKDKGLLAVAPNPEEEHLGKNWRSCKAIVDHNNALFSPLGNAETAFEVLEKLLPEDIYIRYKKEAAQCVAAAFCDSAQECADVSGNEGYVRAETIEAESADSLREAILANTGEVVREVGARRPWSDIMILCRANDSCRMLAEYLLDQGVPVITENSLLLSRHPLIIQAAAFLSFINNPDDNLAFWTFVSGSIFLGHLLAAPLTLVELQDWRAKSGASSLRRAFQQDFPAQWDRLIAPFHSEAALLAPYDLVSEWFSLMRVEERFPEERTFLRRFMEVVHATENHISGSLGAFLEYWEKKGDEELTPMPENADAVRIMTIHKAKGLEAPVVIVPWTNFQISPISKVAPASFGDILIPVSLRSKAAGEAWQEEWIRQTMETLNLLYVALTRPREELYFFRGVSGGRNPNKNLVPGLDILLEKAGLPKEYYEKGDRPEQVAFAPSQKTEDHPVPVCQQETAPPPGFIGPLRPWRPMQWLPRLKIFRARPATKKLTRAERGIILHFCLEHLAFRGDPAEDAAQALAFGIAHCGIPVPDEPGLRAGLLAALEWFASLPEAPGWLKYGWPEQSLMTEEGKTLRADLLVPQKNGMLVIDYKTGHAENPHVEQVRNYMRCAESSGQIQGKMRGLLIYLDLRKFRVVDFQEYSDLLDECPAVLL